MEAVSVTDKLAQLQAQQAELLKARKRLEATTSARHSLIEYMLLTMPDPQDPDDVTLSKYQITPQARLLCQIIEKVERGELQRVAVSIGPQFGKSQILSRGAPSWLTGRDPTKNIILGSYNQDFANEFGDDVRAIVTSNAHRQVFPEHELRKGGQAKDLLITTKNGKTAFVGVGGSGTGKPADVFIVDDPIRNDDDAQSPVMRQRVWSWFTKVANTRIHNDSAIIVVHCLAGGTMVSMADGTQKPIRDVRTGDQVATYENGGVSAASVLNWVNHGPDQVFEIRMKSGAAVKANARHPFLVVGAEGEKWQRTDTLKKGDVIRQVITANGKGSFAPQEDVTNRQSARACARRTTTNLNGRSAIWRRLRKILRVGAERTSARVTASSPKNTIDSSPSKRVFARSASDQPTNATPPRCGRENFASITATTAALCVGFFATVATWLSGTREPKLSCSQPPNTFGITEDVVIEVVEAGVEDVFDIQVERTENFIANGLASHNTRWHEDDLIGRLCDPDHPLRNKDYAGISEDWTYINLPAVVDDPDLAKALGLTLMVQDDELVRAQFGIKPIAALWPQRFSLNFLAKQKRMDKRGFASLRMGKPAPEDGDYFKAADLVEYYSPAELPKNLRKYGASDHAVTEKQKNDASVIGCVGIDENDDIWVLPDIVWDRMETDGIVEALLAQFKAHKPLLFWMESENISKSFGPFLRKRMREEQTYVAIDPVTVSKDKKSRARSIQGRIQMHKVHFPVFAPWWPDMKNELLKFPYGTHDDAVDWLAHIGQGLTKETAAPAERIADDNVVRVGSMAWVLAQTKKRERGEEHKKVMSKW